jgi:sugar phosphate isomerase/epimerase
MTLAVGLNPYGLPYTLGLQGNEDGTGLEGFLEIAREIGARVVELHQPWLDGLDLTDLARRLDGAIPVVSCGRDPAADDAALECAVALGASVVRMALTGVLQGDRHATDWPRVVDGVRARLARIAPRAAAAGVSIAIENHQDFTSAELMKLCVQAGDAVGITLDTGNSFPVGESPLDFARTVAARVRHVHLKDYRVQPTDAGYRLVRCAIGEGAVPFRELVEILGRDLTASLEPGALEARHIRLFTPEWWRGYAPKDARRLAAALRAARVNRLADDEDHRTPWERGVRGEELIRYERDMMRASAANVRTLGIME